MSKIFFELRRRNVFRVGIAYLISSWLLLQITDILVPVLLLPEWVPRFVFLLQVIGFFPTLLFAWAYELTPEGIKREKYVNPEESISGETGRRLNYLIIGVLTVAVGVLLTTKYLIDSTPTTDRSSQRPPTIAVLPFEAMSSNPDDENFADGLTEELLNSLAKIGELGVVGRTSSFYFKDKPQDLREIGAALDVAHVLEGSVRRDGDRLRITAQLIQTDSGFHTWSETFDRNFEDIFAIQEEIAGHVADALQVSILGTEAEALRQHGTTNPEAHARYLIASSYVRRGQAFGLDASQELDNLATARGLLEEATVLDPQFAEAWAQLAIAYHQLTGWGVVDGSGVMLAYDEATRLAEEASSNAIELAPGLALAWSARANHLFHSGNRYNQARVDAIGEARDAFERALELDAENITTLELYAEFQAAMADYAKAVALYDRAISLDPLSIARLRQAEAIYFAGDAARAWADYLAVADIYPDAPVNRGIARMEFDRGHFHHGITLLEGERGTVQPIYAWRSLGDPGRANVGIDYFVSLGGEFELMGSIVDSLLERDYERLGSLSSQVGPVLPAAWIAGIYQREWTQLITLLDDVPDQSPPVRNFFSAFARTDIDLANWRQFLGVISSATAYYAHVRHQIGDLEAAERLWGRSLEIADMISNTTPRGIQERHHTRLLVFASRGDVDAAVDEFDAMVDAGWRWLMSAGAFDWTVYAVDWGWFEDSPLLDSVRDHPKFIATLERVKADNARMLKELDEGISIGDILNEGVE